MLLSRRDVCLVAVALPLAGRAAKPDGAAATAPEEHAVDVPEPVAIDARDVAFVESLPLYQPQRRVDGTIRLWGHGSAKRNFMGQLVQHWLDLFAKYQPGIAIDYRMYGTASAVGALVTGRGDLAILGEEISPEALRLFRHARGYEPKILQIATGSVDVNYFDYAHMIFVNRDNPIEQLGVDQLDAIFGAEHLRGPRNVRSWGELGLGGTWAGRHIQPYGWKVDEDFALFFREAVLGGSHRWNNDIREYVHVTRPDSTQYDHGQQILDALARDPEGIAISNVRYAVPAVKALRLSAGAGRPYVDASPANLIAQTYPLVRIIPAVVDQATGTPLQPAVREFLRFILSREGQRALLESSGYLPLSPDVIRAQQALLR
jgi:phosphate transport system substrate-binding protein